MCYCCALDAMLPMPVASKLFSHSCRQCKPDQQQRCQLCVHQTCRLAHCVNSQASGSAELPCKAAKRESSQHTARRCHRAAAVSATLSLRTRCHASGNPTTYHTPHPTTYHTPRTHLAMEVADRQDVEGCAGVNTVHRNCHAVWVAAGPVVAADAAGFAEQMLGNLGLKLLICTGRRAGI